jgi:hypothetical protein
MTSLKPLSLLKLALLSGALLLALLLVIDPTTARSTEQASSAAAKLMLTQGQPRAKHPLDRQWLVLGKLENGMTAAIDPASLQVLTPGDLFTFDLVTVASDGGALLIRFKASCVAKQAKIEADATFDANGQLLSHDQLSPIDRMDTVKPGSILWTIIERLCAGRSLGDKEPTRGNDSKSASTLLRAV